MALCLPRQRPEYCVALCCLLCLTPLHSICAERGELGTPRDPSITTTAHIPAGADEPGVESRQGRRGVRGRSVGKAERDRGRQNRSQEIQEKAPEFDLDHLRLRGAELAAFNAVVGTRLASVKSGGGCRLTVGRGARDEFQRIQDAVDRVGRNEKDSPVTICIGPGVYHETVTIRKGQDGIVFLGNGPDTIIANNKSLAQTGNTWMSATLIVYGERFHALNLMVQNSLKTTKDPAPAVSLLSMESKWERVAITAWHDTMSIYTGSGHLFVDCFIAGIVDITWGFGRAAFVNSTIYIRRLDDPAVTSIGLVAAYGTDAASGNTTAGGLFWNCTVEGEGSAMLARPYREQSMAVFVDCFLGKVLQGQGYMDRRDYLSRNAYTYLEYNSRGPGASERRSYGKVLTTAPPRIYTVAGFLTLKRENV